MTQGTDNLVLEILKKLQADNAYFRQKFSDVEMRLAAIESHLAANHLDSAQLSARVDGLGERINRIERRLELAAN